MKSKILIDNTIQAECLSDFIKNLGKSSVKVVKKLATNVLKKAPRDLDIRGNDATAAASRSPNNVLSTLLEMITFCHTGKGLYLGNFV